FDVQQQACIDKLIGEQLTVVVREDRFQPYCPGVRIDLVVHRQQGSCSQLSLLFPIKRFDRQRLSGFELVEYGGETVFGDGEYHGNRLKLRDDQQPIGIVRTDQVALIHEAQPDASVNGRGDARVRDLQLGVVDLSLIGLDHSFQLPDQRFLGVELLLGDKSLLEEPTVPFE